MWRLEYIASGRKFGHSTWIQEKCSVLSLRQPLVKDDGRVWHASYNWKSNGKWRFEGKKPAQFIPPKMQNKFATTITFFII